MSWMEGGGWEAGMGRIREAVLREGRETMEKPWKPSQKEAVEMARRLADEAMDAIRAGQAQRAVWRLVDAAGLLGREFGGEGYDSPTGRGFKIEAGR